MTSKRIRVALFLLLVAIAGAFSDVEVGMVFSNGDPLGQALAENLTLYRPAYGVSMAYGTERVEVGYNALFGVIPKAQLNADIGECHTIRQYQVVLDIGIVAKLLLRSSDKAIAPFLSIGADLITPLSNVEWAALKGSRLTVDAGLGVDLRLRDLTLSVAGAIVPAMYDQSRRQVIITGYLYAKGSLSVRYRL